MNYAIRIKHYVDGYERLISKSDYILWRKTEQRIGRPIFQVIGFLIDNQYISIKQIVDGLTIEHIKGVVNYDR